MDLAIAAWMEVPVAHEDTRGEALENPDRREFTLQSVLAILSGVTITIAACGDDNPAAPEGGNLAGSISANHNHTAVVTEAQLTAGNAVVLQIQGSASHPHTVELSAPEIGQLAAGQRVSKTSSADNSADFGNHSHTVTFN